METNTEAFALSRIESDLGYKFRQSSLLLAAVTHSSYAHEQAEDCEHNERLEFLGDATLELAISDYLYEQYPQEREGRLSRVRAAVVREPTLAAVARRLGLDKQIRLGGALRSGPPQAAICADCLEAVLGAVFLDGGWTAARELIVRLFREPIEDAFADRLIFDYKSLLQQHFQTYRTIDGIEYRQISKTGPMQAPQFEVGLFVDGTEISRGRGKTIKKAEQEASRAAYMAIKETED
ncbi:MAG: ribonuclease III [Clostridiaceae bacterium]|nr:ribonuclease III [Clostridiaceae bacterium]